MTLLKTPTVIINILENVMKLTREKLRRIIISEMKKIMRPTMAQVQQAYDDEDEDTEDDFLHAYLRMGNTGEFYDYPYDYPDDEEDEYGGFSQESIDMIMSGRPYPKDLNEEHWEDELVHGQELADANPELNIGE
jgi:hypothetical protein